MSICVGYFGDGRSDTAPRIAAAAGYVASKARWRAFDERWPRALRAERLTTFDASDFLRGAGEFAADWIDDPLRRIRLIRSLTALTAKHALCAFSCSLNLDDFDAVNGEYRLAEEGSGPSGICAAGLITTVKRWMSEHHPQDLTLFVFEQGELEQREIRRVLGAEGISTGEPPQLWPREWIDECGRRRRLRPFEACDLLALGSMQPPQERDVVDRERLLAICKALSISRRCELERTHNPALPGRPGARQ